VYHCMAGFSIFGGKKDEAAPASTKIKASPTSKVRVQKRAHVLVYMCKVRVCVCAVGVCLGSI